MIGKALRLSSLLVASLAIGSLAFAKVDSGVRYVSVDVRIELKSGANEATMSALSEGVGRVVSRDEKGFVLRLNDPKNLDLKLKALEGRKSVAKVSPMTPMLPGQDLLKLPLSQLKQMVTEYKESYLAWSEVTKDEFEKRSDGSVKVPGVGYLESYLQWKHDRAFPNDEIDISGYVEIANRRTFEAQAQQNLRGRDSENKPTGNRGLLQNLTGTSDAAGNWEFMGPTDLSVPYRIYFGLSPINGRANAVAFDPTDGNTFYTGGSQGGVWKTTDGGLNWSTTSDGWPLLGVSSLAVSPVDGNIVLAGTGDFYGSDVAGIGVMRSTDGGQTWTRTGLNMSSAMIAGLVFDPANANIVYAVAGRTGGSARGVYRSANSGQTWTEVVTTDVDWSYVDIGGAATNGSRLKWAVSGGSSPQIRTSVDGVNWTSVTLPTSGSQNTFHIAASKISPNTAYLLATTPRKVYKTVDAGATWSDVTAGFPNGSSNYNWSQGWYDYYIKTSVVNGQDMVFVGLIDVVMSINGGASWRTIGGSNYSAAYSNSAIVHQDNHNLEIDPNNPTRALVATDGGVFLFNYNAAQDNYTWGRLNKTLGITQFYTMDVHPTNPNYVVGGTQDNASPHSFGNLSQWGNPGGGDGAGCGINFLNPNIQYTSSQFHGLSRTTNAWNSQSGFAPSFGSDSVPFIGDLWLDPNDPTNVYVNTNYLWRYKEGTNTWTPRLGGQLLSSNGQVRSLGIAPGDSNVMYTGASNGDLYMSRNFGSSWTRLDALVGLPNSSILDISVNPRNKNDILVATGNSRMFRITGTNTGAPTLTSINGAGGTALPNVAISTIARDPWQPETRWYVGTDVGVFTTDNAGASWTDITRSLGLPNVQVTRLKANATTGYLTAATYGRGIWRIKIVPAIVQSVVATPTSVIGGDGGTLTVTIDRPAPSGGVLVPLSSNSGSLIVPSSVLIPTGQSSVQVPYTTNEVGATVDVTITATLGGIGTAIVQVLATSDYPATSFTLQNAKNIVGGLPEILTSDDNRLTWQIDRVERQASKAIFSSAIGISSPTKVRIEVEVSSDLPGSVYSLFLAANLGSRSNLIASGPLTATDGVIRFDITDPSVVLGPNGEISITLVTSGPANTQFTTRVDRVRFRALP